VRNPIRLSGILLLSALSIASHAQRVYVTGVKRAADCEFATRPLIADLQELRYPKEWNILVACNSPVWERLQRKADAFETKTAFTNLQGHITVLNGEIYRQMLPLRGTDHRTPRLVLKHELGHIICGCDGEARADRVGEYPEPRLRMSQPAVNTTVRALLRHLR
jgi:hypothetical protein